MPRGTGGQRGEQARFKLRQKLLKSRGKELDKALEPEILDNAKSVTGDELKLFLEENHDKLHAEPEGFGIVIAFIIEYIALRYKMYGNLDASKADIMHLIEDGVPPVFQYDSGTRDINIFYKDALTKLNLTMEQNIAQANLVGLLRAYKTKIAFLKNDTYCNEDGSLKDGLTLADLQKDFVQDQDMRKFLESELVPKNWGEAANLSEPAIAGVKPEEAKALGIQTFGAELADARANQSFAVEQTPEQAEQMVVTLIKLFGDTGYSPDVH